MKLNAALHALQGSQEEKRKSPMDGLFSHNRLRARRNGAFAHKILERLNASSLGCTNASMLVSGDLSDILGKQED